MHIKAVCPRCDSTYQVDEGLKGKRMRCPNPICRAVFEVRDEASATPPPVPIAPRPPSPAPPARGGSVGDVIPILTAEQAPTPEPHRPSAAAEPPATVAPAAQNPPPLDDFFAGAKPVVHLEAPPVASDGAPLDGWADAPPVRQRVQPAPPSETNGTLLTVHPPFEYAEPPRQRSRWPLLAACLLLVAMGGGGAWLFFHSAGPTDEDQRAAKAEQAYKDRDYGEAASLFSTLAKDFPQSDQRASYLFLAELSAVRDPIHRPQVDKEETLGHLKRLSDFLEVYKTDPQIEKHYADVAESLYKLVEELTTFAAKTKDRDLLDQARRLNAEAARYKPAPLPQATAIAEAFGKAQQQVAVAEARKALVDRLTQAVAAPTLDAVENAAAWAKQEGLAEDAEIKALVDQLPAAHRNAIAFSADGAGGAASLAEDSAPSLAFLAYRGQRPTASAASGSRPVLAVVRGLLYALEPQTGTVRWIRRVGIDTTAAPLWIPATPASPPAVLVCASGASGLVALDAADGNVRWAQVLPEPCVGKPVLVGDRAWVACASGSIYEIEITGGRRLGRYDLGQPLSHGGVHHPGTNLLYFAGDRSCVFALDIAAKRCSAILYTGHASGSLRCPPVVLPLVRGPSADSGKQTADRALLLLCLDDGNRGTQLTTYALPLGEAPPTPVPLGEVLPGRVSFAPHVNAEQVAVVTDTGTLEIFGLKQRDNSDPDIFPLLRETIPSRDGAAAGPAMVVHADGQNIWVLARDRLHHLRILQSPTAGWQMVLRPLPLPAVGAALQEAEVIVDDLGTGLFMVTESPDGLACWITGIDADKHALRWQRQLGVVCQGNPVAVDRKVLMADRSGSLLLFEPDKELQLPGGLWKRGGKTLVPALTDQPGQAWILPGADRVSAMVLASGNRELRLWKYHDGGATALGPAHALDAVAGTPALLGETVLVPLANGRLARLGAQGAALLDAWRSPSADKQALGHVVALGPAKVAATDGSQGVVLWRFDGKDLQNLGASKFRARVLAVASLPGTGDDARLCVADASRMVTLLHGDALQKVRSWTLSGNITAGPFARAGLILVVVDNRRLVWIDPEKEQLPGLAFSFPADIVGQIEIVDGVLIVADETGQIQGFDPKTARKVGEGYTLRADVAPSAAPLPFGPDRLFVPLTDGSILLPSRLWFLPWPW